jgi:hypothetical protein
MPDQIRPDEHDDGLVHPHHWATEHPQPGLLPPRAPDDREVHAPEVAKAMAADQDEGPLPSR